MFVSGWKWKTRKIIIPFPALSFESLVSVKENTDIKRKITRKKEKKNTDRTQTKLNAPHVTYNVKILSQYLIIPDKQIWYFLDFQQRNLSKLEKVYPAF